MKPSAVTTVVEAAGELAENPLWHPDRRLLYWTDIPAGKIHTLNPATGEHRIVYEGQAVGGFVFQENGDLLLFRVNDIAQLHSDGRVTTIREFTADGMQRFNDVIADPVGRIFAGTFGEHPKCGLYRLDLDGTVTKLFLGTGCSNGMGFSPDSKTFYWTCSTARKIFQFDYEQRTGEVLDRRIFHAVPEGEGIPDGLTIDSGGNVWSARWGGSSIVWLSPDGKVLDRISIPSTNVTSICIGGENLDQLFVTSAQEPGRLGQGVGVLFRVDIAIRGVNEFRSRIS